ncbi:GntR family transcriptional regulator [Paracoccus rhizosphaerae]|uniref:GntR family transcriptional regulator n=1 Tax=Paracoccus rhizosphaerae TaxID=1133347 RepID=A0ABV6CFL4_9RHOB|nr:GntR family transcriptional regulator [Paracoccus rhizosphaerae]
MTAPRSAEQVHAALAAQIVQGRLAPGAPLAETALAEQFGLSRTPVREALQKLAGEGLVERGPRRAFVVRRMSADALRHLFEALGELEALCAGMAARRMSAAEIAMLNRILHGDGPGVDYADVNIRFHDALRQGAQNQVLAGLLEDLNRRSLPWRNAQFTQRAERIDTSRAEHRAILEAVTARDADRAAALMRAHMGAALGTVLELIATR